MARRKKNPTRGWKHVGDEGTVRHLASGGAGVLVKKAKLLGRDYQFSLDMRPSRLGGRLMKLILRVKPGLLGEKVFDSNTGRTKILRRTVFRKTFERHATKGDPFEVPKGRDPKLLDEEIAEAIDWAEGIIGEQSVDLEPELAEIGAYRLKTGQRPLDPEKAGWTADDIIAEAERIRKNPRKKAKKKVSRANKNPYDTKAKMQNIASDLWKYRGYEIAVIPAPATMVRASNRTPTGRFFTTKIKRVTPLPSGQEDIDKSGKRMFHLSEDIPSLLELARLEVDAHEYRNSLPPAKRKLFHSMDLEIAAAFYILKDKGASISRAAVARELQTRSFLPAGRQWPVERAVYDFFNSLPVKDRMAWLDARLKRLRLQEDLPLTNPRKKAKKKVSRVKKNPYDTKAKMQNIASDLWKYRGHEIEVLRDVDIDGNKVFHAKITRVVPLSPDQEDILSMDRDDPGKYLHKDVPDALEMARLAIDRAEYRNSLPPGAKRTLFSGMWLNIVGAFYRLRGDPTSPIVKSPSRAAVARELELLGRKAKGRTRIEYSFFQMLSVKDRTAFLDATLKELRLQEGLPLTKNPKKKAKKKVSRVKKNPYDTKGKMQNIASDLWKYRGYEIAVSRRKSLGKSSFIAQLTRVGPRPKGDFLDDLDGGAFSHKDEADLLEIARLRIDAGLYKASLSPTRAFYFERMNGEISAAFTDVHNYQQRPLTRANVTRQIEKLHQKAKAQTISGAGTPFSDPKDALKAFAFFNGLSVKDRLAWVDAKIKELKLIQGIPLTNPRKKAKKKTFRRKKNPYRTRAMAKFLADGVWMYRGYEIKTLRKDGRYTAKIKLVQQESSCSGIPEMGLMWIQDFRKSAPDEQSIIQMARLSIDKTCYYANLPRGIDLINLKEFVYMDGYINHVIYMLTAGGVNVTRAGVTRYLEREVGQKHVAPIRVKEAYAYFNSLPVNDRLAWVDAQIRMHDLEHGKSLKNPRKKKARLNPYETKKKMRNIASDIWRYGPYEVKTSRVTKPYIGHKAAIIRVGPPLDAASLNDDPLHGSYTTHKKEASALELVRMYVDEETYVESLPKKDREQYFGFSYLTAREVNNLASSHVDEAKRGDFSWLNRANLARILELEHKKLQGKARRGTASSTTSIKYLDAFDFFNSIPVKDRLSWFDSNIKMYKLKHGIPLTNPRKKAKKKVSRRKKNPEDWDFTEAKRRLRKARHALENADRGGYRSEGTTRTSALSDYVSAYQEAAMGVFILNRMIFLDIDASRAKRALWVHSARGVMQGEGEALDVFWNTTEAIFRQCGIRITPEMKQTLSLHFIGSVSKDLQSWKARPTGSTVLPSPEDLDSWISAASLTVTKWKHGQKPRMKREGQILFLLDVLASTFITATAAQRLQPLGKRPAGTKAPRLLVPAITLGIDAEELLAAECKEGQRERARTKHARRSGNPPKKAKKKLRKDSKRKKKKTIIVPMEYITKPPTAKEFIAKCQKLWEAYCKKPGVTKLRAVAKHCEAMRTSSAKTVAAERRSCERSVRAEAKARGWKL